MALMWECKTTKNIPFPRSSGSAWTTTALPMTEFGPESGICNGGNNSESLKAFNEQKSYRIKSPGCQ